MSGMGGFGELFGTSGYVEDELFVVSSHTVLRDVTKSLKLNNTCIVKTGLLKSVEKFEKSPLELVSDTEIADTLGVTLKFDVYVDENGLVEIEVTDSYKDVVANIEEQTLPVTIETKYGTFTLRKTTNYVENEDLKAKILFTGYDIAAELNLYFAKASLGAQQKGIIPQVSDDGSMLLKNARHPLIDPKTVVPININLGIDFHALIITGPNTGGKTVALKTVGLLTAMAMCGLMIPASDGSRIACFDRILVDIGDRQSIEYNLSTFSAHTLQDIEIIKAADDRTLVLMDELGSGTDPVEGAALAVAVIERLRMQGAEMIVTTHYQELKRYALETADVENASCEFNLETLKPTYRLVIGSPGKSNAFAISSSLGMPEDVIAHAKKLVSTENQRFEKAVEQLDRTRAEHEKALAELEQLKSSIAVHEKEIREQAELLEQRREEELTKIRTQARRIVEQTVTESNALLEELRDLKKQKDQADFAQKIAAAKSHSNQTINRLYENSDTDEQGDYTLPRELQIGDSVLVVSMGRSGTVIAEPTGKVVTVQIGAMKTRVPIENLRLEKTAQAKKKQEQKKVHATVVRSEKGKSGGRSAANEVDIRGCTVDEGIMMVENFIAGSLLSGFETVTIIHGKGTGALRKGIHEHLRRMKQVKSFRLGVYGEGEDGVTVVTLK